MRGDGRIFQQKGSPYLWLAYYCRGKEHRESARTTDPDVAARLLRRRLKEVGGDQIGARRFLGPAAERVRMEELFDALETAKKNNGAQAPSEMPRLRKRWRGWRAMEVNGTAIEKWKSEMLAEELTPKTVRNYCQLLGEAFRLALEQELIAYAPPIKSIKVPDNARDGTFTRAEFERVKTRLPEYLRDFAEWSYWTGWRAGAIRSLRWEEIKDGVLTCRPQYSKNRRATSVPLTGPLAEIVARRGDAKRGPYVFHYDDGRPIGSYKTAWGTARRIEGLEKKKFHDFRRTAATELRRAGVPEEVAMKITGHVTNSMFKRYRIVDDSDTRLALEQRAAYETVKLAAAKAKAEPEAAAAAGRASQLAAVPAASARLQ